MPQSHCDRYALALGGLKTRISIFSTVRQRLFTHSPRPFSIVVIISIRRMCSFFWWFKSTDLGSIDNLFVLHQFQMAMSLWLLATPSRPLNDNFWRVVNFSNPSLHFRAFGNWLSHYSIFTPFFCFLSFSDTVWFAFYSSSIQFNAIPFSSTLFHSSSCCSIRRCSILCCEHFYMKFNPSKWIVRETGQVFNDITRWCWMAAVDADSSRWRLNV